MPQSRSPRGSLAGTRIVDVFSTAVYDSFATNPNCCPRSFSPGNARSSYARRWLAIGATTSPPSPNDGSSARSPRAGGGGRRTPIADRPDEDNSDDQLDQEAFLNTLAASGQLMLISLLKSFSRSLRPRTRQSRLCSDISRLPRTTG